MKYDKEQILDFVNSVKAVMALSNIEVSVSLTPSRRWAVQVGGARVIDVPLQSVPYVLQGMCGVARDFLTKKI